MGTLAVVMSLLSVFLFYLYRPQIRKAANAPAGVIFGNRIFEQEIRDPSCDHNRAKR